MFSTDRHWMRAALDLAESGRGYTTPNPLVGAVIVRAGQMVGAGYHKQAGGPHAETFALQAAGEAARGADLYVTLEPCAHYGRTPPCADAVIAAGIRRVVLAMIDPDPRVCGKGAARLRQAGIEVVAGVCEMQARRQNAAYITRMTKHRPHVIWKSALTLDGHPATRTGASFWITGEEARRCAHTIRAWNDAIMVGAGTVLADDPQLTARPAGMDPAQVRQPARIIVDSHLRIPPTARCLDPAAPGRAIVATTTEAPPDKTAALSAQGVEVWQAPPVAGRVDLARLLADLHELEISSILLEGGPTLTGSFFDLGLVDQCMIFIAPLIFGGTLAPPALGGSGVATPAQAVRLTQVRRRRCGADLLIMSDSRPGYGR